MRCAHCHLACNNGRFVWFCQLPAGLVPDTLSKLPPSLLQRLTLYDITQELPDSTLSELGRLNSLQVLHLLLFQTS